jgi:alpha-1,3-rhamnosyl/mannosyltransferase
MGKITLMRVCLDTSTLRVRHAGIAVYTLELSEALLSQIAPDESLTSFDGMHGFVPIDAGWLARQRFDNEARSSGPSSSGSFSARMLEDVMRGGTLRRRLARLAKEARFAAGQRHFDLCHAVVTLPPGKTSKPLIPLIYDVSIQRFPATHPAERLRAFDRWWPAVEACPVINTISVFSRDEIVNVLGYPRERIAITHPGVHPFFFEPETAAEEAALAGFALDRRQVILLVGTQEPRKNIGVALAAFAALPHTLRSNATLIVSGGSGWGELKFPRNVEALIEAGDIRFSGYVSRLQLRALYRRAALLVFPSVYEGFGIPVAEALAVGTSVAVSRGTSLEEAAGPHGARIAPDDIEGWRDTMKDALTAPQSSPEVQTSRRNWAKRFSWQETATRTLAMYRSVLANAPLSQALREP